MKQKKGISPIFASILLIAVTIAIGVAIAGFVFGIFATYSAAPMPTNTSTTTTNPPIIIIYTDMSCEQLQNIVNAALEFHDYQQANIMLQIMQLKECKIR
jgi:flagellin-like protein